MAGEIMFGELIEFGIKYYQPLVALGLIVVFLVIMAPFLAESFRGKRS
jgi:hypothetical protein